MPRNRALARACFLGRSKCLKTLAEAFSCQTQCLVSSEPTDVFVCSASSSTLLQVDLPTVFHHPWEGAASSGAYEVSSSRRSSGGASVFQQGSHSAGSPLTWKSQCQPHSEKASVAEMPFHLGCWSHVGTASARMASSTLWGSSSAAFGGAASRSIVGAAEKNEGGGDSTETIQVTFVTKEGEEKVIKVPVGTSMLEAAHQNDIELEGACEGSLACSTCHVIVMDENYFKKLPEPTDEENDMLDLAFGLTETSRLGCQIVAQLEINGIRLATPGGTADARQT